MHLEACGEKEITEAEVQRAIEMKLGQAGGLPVPWLGEHYKDAVVAEASKCSLDEARKLPVFIWCERLMKGSADAEALPAQMEAMRKKQETKGIEQEQSQMR